MIKFAIHGKQESGKSTLADYMSDLYGFDVFAFAHNLKMDLVDMGVDPKVMDTKPWPRWLRRLAQLYGMQMREVDLNYWINRCMSDIAAEDPDAVVIDDLRFFNEAEYLQGAGYVMIKVVKLGASNDDNHQSETDLDSWDAWDYVIEAEEGDLLSLFEQLDNIIEKEG